MTKAEAQKAYDEAKAELISAEKGYAELQKELQAEVDDWTTELQNLKGSGSAGKIAHAKDKIREAKSGMGRSHDLGLTMALGKATAAKKVLDSIKR